MALVHTYTTATIEGELPSNRYGTIDAVRERFGDKVKIVDGAPGSGRTKRSLPLLAGLCPQRAQAVAPLEPMPQCAAGSAVSSLLTERNPRGVPSHPRPEVGTRTGGYRSNNAMSPHPGKHSRRAEPRASSAGAKSARWSAHVMKTSNALDLEQGVFKLRSPKAIAASLKRSALASHRRKSEPFRSAMAMLSFHINRAGRGLSAERRRTLERAKVELRKTFGRPV